MQSSLSISSFKVLLKRTVAVILLMSVIIVIVLRYFNLVHLKDTFYDFYRYVPENTVDVLCVGSSHIFCGIDPIRLYEEYGIAAYDLANGSQSLWFSYYYIEEALKRQKPEIIILDVFPVYITDDSYFDEKVQMNLLTMRPSLTKWKALQTANIDRGNRLEVFWEFPVAHTKYDSLGRWDYESGEGANNRYAGYAYHDEIEVYEADSVRDVSMIRDGVPISSKAEEYLRKCIELCHQEGIEILLVNAPWPDITEEAQKHYNYVQTIADEYQIPFLNGCLYQDTIGMDYSRDSMGDRGHLNYSGVTKFTKWLGRYLHDHYDLKDRRSDDRYGYWERTAEKLHQKIWMRELEEESDFVEYTQRLKDREHVFYFAAFRGLHMPEMKEFSFFEKVDISTDGGFAFADGNLVFTGTEEENYAYTQYWDKDVFHISEENGQWVGTFNRDLTMLRIYQDIAEIEIFVYNELTGDYSSAGFLWDGKQFVRS